MQKSCCIFDVIFFLWHTYPFLSFLSSVVMKQQYNIFYDMLKRSIVYVIVWSKKASFYFFANRWEQWQLSSQPFSLTIGSSKKLEETQRSRAFYYKTVE